MGLDLSMDGVVRFGVAAAAVASVSIIVILAVIVLYKIATGKIDISGILSTSQDASLSRFQFLIFTFTISFCYLMILLYQLLHTCDATGAKALCVSGIKLPDGAGAALLLGISGGSYALGKGIQTSGDASMKNTEVTANAAASAATAAATGQQTVAETVTTTPGGGASGTVTATTPTPAQGGDGES